MDAFGPTLDYFCERQGVTLKELAEQIGVSRNTIGYWKTRGKPPDRETTLRLAEKLLLDEDETNELLAAAGYASRHSVKGSNLRSLSQIKSVKVEQMAVEHLEIASDSPQDARSTRFDYLRWLIDRHLYLDLGGIPQENYHEQVKLDDIYIWLRARHEQAPVRIDTPTLEPARLLVDAKTTENNVHIGEIVNVARVVQNQTRVVLLGNPGSGKSTLLRYLALKHAQALYHGQTQVDPDLGTIRFPILLRIADYAEYGLPRGVSLGEYLAENAQMHECPKQGLADLLATELHEGNCFVLLDGLDEVVNVDDRRKVVERIKDFVRFYGNRSNHFVITSRVAGYHAYSLSGLFIHYTLKEMDDSEIHHFLERWYRATLEKSDLPKESKEALLQSDIAAIRQAVHNSPGVRHLASTPLLLRLLALVDHNGERIPQKRIELYQRAVETLTHTWRVAQGVPESALGNEEYLTPLLSTLAYWLHENKPTGIATEKEVHRILGQVWARLKGRSWEENHPDIEREIKQFLLIVREHTGLFLEQAPNRYGFSHLTFEEYYAANYLVAHSEDRAKLIREHLHHSRWEEPILLALGLVGMDSPENAAELLETAILAEGKQAEDLAFTPSSYEELLGRDYLFALRCLGDNIPVRTEVMEHLMKRLADEILHSSGHARFHRYRLALYERLEYLGTSEDVFILLPLFIEALYDRNPTVCSSAASALARLGHSSPEAVTALSTALLSASNSETRSAAGVGLGGLSSPQAVAALSTALLSGPGVRDTVISALEDMGYTSFQIPLLESLLPQQTKSIQKEVDLASSQIVATLINVLSSDPEPFMRRTASESLSQVRQPSSQIVTAFINALRSDPDSLVRSTSARNLAEVGQTFPEVVTVLSTALSSDHDSHVRDSLISSLSQYEKALHQVVASLVNTLRFDPDFFMRMMASESLKQIGQSSPEVSAALSTALLNDSHVLVREAAIWSLLRLEKSSSEIVPLLSKALNSDPAAQVRRTVASALATLGQNSAEAVIALKKALFSDLDAQVRLAAALNIGKVDASFLPEIIVPLKDAMLSDREYLVRYGAAASLAEFGRSSAEAAAVLITILLTNTDSFMRYLAADMLAKVGSYSSDAVEALIHAMLHDSVYIVRRTAAISLGRLNFMRPEVTIALIEKLGANTGDWETRQDTASLLGQVGQCSEGTVQALWDGLYNEDGRVRMVCANALAQLGRRCPDTGKIIEAMLIQAIEDSVFDKPGNASGKRSARDYVYDGLWLLIVGAELDDGRNYA